MTFTHARCTKHPQQQPSDLLQAQRWHVGSEPFGRQWQSGDVVGCMIDLIEMNIMFTLNGEMLISDSGSEMAFKDIEIGEGQSTRWRWRGDTE